MIGYICHSMCLVIIQFMSAIFAKLGIVFVSGAMAVGTFFVSSAFVVFHHGGRYDPCRYGNNCVTD